MAIGQFSPGWLGHLRSSPPTVVNRASFVTPSNATSHPVTLPSSIVAGNLLVILAAHASSAATLATPTNWSSLGEDASGSRKLYLFYKIADGTEGSTVSISSGGFALRVNSFSWQLSGVSADPEKGTFATGSNTSADPPSLSPSWGTKPTLWFAATTYTGTGTTSAYPSGYGNTQHNTSTFALSVAELTSTASSENPGAFTIVNSGTWLAQTFGFEGT